MRYLSHSPSHNVDTTLINSCTLPAYITAVAQPYLLWGDPAVTFSLDIVFLPGCRRAIVVDRSSSVL